MVSYIVGDKYEDALQILLASYCTQSYSCSYSFSVILLYSFSYKILTEYDEIHLSSVVSRTSAHCVRDNVQRYHSPPMKTVRETSDNLYF